MSVYQRFASRRHRSQCGLMNSLYLPLYWLEIFEQINMQIDNPYVCNVAGTICFFL